MLELFSIFLVPRSIVLQNGIIILYFLLARHELVPPVKTEDILLI